MLRKMMEIVVYVYLACILTGCAAIPFAEGETYRVFSGTAAWAAQRAFLGKPDSILMLRDTALATFTWIDKVGWVGTLITKTTCTDMNLCGNTIASGDIKGFVANMIDNGWKTIGYKDVPLGIKLMISNAAWLNVIAGKIPLYMVMPEDLIIYSDGISS